uniref:Putative ovule protein n=1 Tax=Solanum chacoense TaxID=4108 RepID=A0A0V0HUB9_SOLCH
MYLGSLPLSLLIYMQLFSGDRRIILIRTIVNYCCSSLFFIIHVSSNNWYQSLVLSEYALWLQHNLNFHIREGLLWFSIFPNTL